MECNKDEAVKAKEISEQKLLERDVSGAKKFALKAQGLFPKLDGLSQFLEIINVHVAHERKINGEADYYGIFGVDPMTDGEILKTQYKRMALALHPDKNKSVGAEGAFKILSEAWSVLSDIDKRSAYDLKLRASNQTGGSFSSPTASYTVPATDPQCVPTRPRTHVQAEPTCNRPHIFRPIPTRQAPTRPPVGAQFIPVQRPQFQHQDAPLMYQATFRPETFWTSCSQCGALYEYCKVYLNQILLCYHCWLLFLATEMPAPQVNNHSFRSVPASPAGISKETVNMRRDKDAVMKNSSGIPEENIAASASNAVGGLDREKPKKRRTNFQKYDCAGEGTSGSRTGIKRADENLKGNIGAKDEAEIRVMLMRKANMEILGVLNEWEAAELKSSHTKRVETKDSANTIKDAMNCESVSMMVPDANFHNFDVERIEMSFSKNQVWAVYDDDDGMPRHYALVQRVISRKPFKLQISWLNARSTSEFGPVDWIGSGFTKTSGGFRVGKYVVVETLNSFSHIVKWEKGPRGAIQIFPTKGDVWAVYRNWSPDWVEGTTTVETIHKYGLVVVLENYNEDVGVPVAPLVKVAGFTSVFNLNERDIHTIPREEMFRFSHQVPFYILNGLEAENAPMGYYELDPAALPLELLQVITDVGSS